MNEKLDTLETGLRGIAVGYCPTSFVDPQKGLFYGEYPASLAAAWQPEEVLYLLVHGKRGSEGEVKDFALELKQRGSLSQETIAAIEALPKQGDPMKLFPASILLLGTLEGTGDYKIDCLNLIAKIPYLTATLINYHGGFGKTPSPDKNLSYMDNFVHMLKIPNTNPEELRKVLTLYNILHYDHGGGNLSTFVGKAVASGLEDLYGSVAAAMSALAGPRHGRANQESLHFVQQAFCECGEDADESSIEAFLRKKIANKELIFGFGHAVLRVEDPRATLQYELAAKLYPHHPLVKIALLLRKVGPRILKENPNISNPYPNVDAISGTLLTAAGFTQDAYYTPLFGLSRSCGIAIQIVYERCYARDGKGTPIVRPKYIYKPFIR